MQNNVFLSWLQEMFLRFSTKSPKFFVIWQWISGVITAISGLPAFLTQLGVVLPPSLMIFENKVVGAAAAAVLFMSLMPAQGTITKTDTNGAPLKTTDPEKLPFTNASEKKAIAPKAAVIILVLLMSGIAGFSQNTYHGFNGFLSPLPRYASPHQFRNAKATTLLPDSTYRGFRPIGSLVVQAYPGASTLAGLGFDYEFNTYSASTQTWYTNYAIGLLVYAGGTIAPTTPNAVIATGLNLSLLNKRLSIGGAYDFVNKRPLLTFGTTLSFVSN